MDGGEIVNGPAGPMPGYRFDCPTCGRPVGRFDLATVAAPDGQADGSTITVWVLDPCGHRPVARAWRMSMDLTGKRLALTPAT